MKIDKLVGERFKEKPSDCVIDSHALMLRGGYMKNVANGIYSSFMPLRRITRKIENIIREEMDAAGGQEIHMSAIQPSELWEESGRWYAYGPELWRIKDRHCKSAMLDMPRYCSSVSGKCFPISPSAAAPRSASISA